MSIKKNTVLLGAFCTAVAVAVTAMAQNDLDNLLSDLETTVTKKPAAAAEQTKPKEEAKVVEEKKAEEAKSAVAEVKAEEKPAEEAKPAVAEVKAEEKPAEEAKPAVAETKAEEKPAEEAKPAVAETKAEEKPAEDAKPAVAEAKVEEKPAEDAKPAVAEAKAEEKPAEDAKAVAAPAPVQLQKSDEQLIADLTATELLRREALDKQAKMQIESARSAMDARDYDTATRYYKLALQHLNDRPESLQFRRECNEGVAEAQYLAGRAAFKAGNREVAKAYAEEALKWNHPRARTLLDALSAERTQVAEKDFSEIKHRRNDEDYKKDRDLIRSRLRLSAQFMAVGDLDKALEECDLVLRYDAYNREALALRTRIQRRRDVIIEKEREATRRGMIADIGAAWRPVYAINSAELKETDGGTAKTPISGDPDRSIEQSIEQRMKEMMLPSITFKPPATIIDAVDFFRQASKDYDRPEIPVDQRGFNFVLDFGKPLTSGGEEAAAGNAKSDDNAFASSNDGDAAAASGDIPQIPNISASNVSLWDAMQLVCKISGFKFKIQKSIVTVMPKDMTTDELIQRSYSVNENFLEKMNNASSSLKEQKAGSFGSKEEGEGGGGDGSESDWKAYFAEFGVFWPQNSHIKYFNGKLRVTNTAEQLAVFEGALQELNVTPELIEVETRFVEVAQEDLNSLGFEWLLNSDYSLNVGGKLGKALGLKDGTFDSNTSSDPTANVNSKWIKPTDAIASDGNVGVNAIDGTTYATGMRYLSTEGNHISGEGSSTNDKFMRVNAFLGNADMSMILHMLSQRSDTDLLSAPKVVTKSGEEATIKVVTIYRYPQDYDVTIQSTSSGSSSSSSSSSGGGDGKILPMVEPQNFSEQEVGVILMVKPEKSPEGDLINLELHPKIVSEPTWKDYGMKVPMSVVESSSLNASFANTERWFTVPMEQPFFKERSIETKLSVYSGATVVMGGLITEDRKSMEDKIPFLGDIPYIGRFFRSRSEWSDKRNLLLFVTARLVDPRGRQKTVNGSDESVVKAPVAAASAPIAPAPEPAK